MSSKGLPVIQLPTLNDTIDFCRSQQVLDSSLDGKPLRCLVPLTSTGSYEVLPYDDRTPYIAISYTWPSSGWRRLHNSSLPCTVLRSGHRVTSEHLSNFAHKSIEYMLNNAQSPNTTIWMDHECIVQNNNQEKTRQVAVMDKIYTRAIYTAILLEDIELSTQEYESMLIPKFRRENSNWFVGIIKRILGARWFSRAWCSQEMILSRSSMVFVHRSGNVDMPISFSYTALAGWVVAASIYDTQIKKLPEPRGLSPAQCTLTMHTTAWAWGMLHPMSCYNEYDKISLVLNMTRSSFRLLNVPDTRGKGNVEDKKNICKIINTLSILNGDCSLLSSGHSRHNIMLGIDGFGWSATPQSSDIPSENWHPQVHYRDKEKKTIPKDKLPSLTSRGLDVTGVAATVMTQETWCIWREQDRLLASVDGVVTDIPTSWLGCESLQRNLNQHVLRDVLLVITHYDAKHVFRSFIHPDEDHKLTCSAVEIADLKGDIVQRFGRSTAFNMSMAREIHLMQHEGKTMFTHLKFANGHAMTAYGNVDNFKSTTVLQPHGMRPNGFGDYLFTVNAFVLAGTVTTMNGTTSKCIGQIRCFQMLPEGLGEVQVTLT